MFLLDSSIKQLFASLNQGCNDETHWDEGDHYSNNF